MNKRDIVRQLEVDRKALEVLSASRFASDSKIRIDSKLEYVLSLLERIQQGGKV